MKIAVVGAGGVGGYFGARLAAAGHRVAFVARGSHLAAMRRDGLRVESAAGDLHLKSVNATDDPAEIGEVDVVLFTVKLWDTEGAALRARPLVGRETAVIPLQNGVDSIARIGGVLGSRHLLGGVALIFANIAEPGRIRHNGALATIQFGEPDGRISARAKAFESACREAGIGVELSERIVPLIWEKFIYLASLSGVTALTRHAIGQIRDNPETWSLYERAVNEVAAVAAAKRIAVADGIVHRILDFVRGLPAGNKSSLLIDLENGRKLELPWLSGAVVRIGRELDVPTPVHELIVAALALFADGAPRAD